MRALWSDRQNCSHNVSQKFKRIKRVPDSDQGKQKSGSGFPKKSGVGIVSGDFVSHGPNQSVD